MKENQPLSLARAQEAIGFDGDSKGRRLFRELRSREKALGVAIMVRRQHESRTRCYVTVAAIRRHAPDLVPSRTSSLLREAQQYLEAVNERIDERVAEQCERQYQRRVMPELQKLRAEQENTAETVLKLSATVSRIAGVPTSTR